MGHECTINPLGTTFNPAALANTLERLSTGTLLSTDDIRYCERTQLFYSFEAGTVHVHEDRDECTASINAALTDARIALASSSALFLTLGSAWAYAHPDGPTACDGIVLNCHRQPQAEFARRLMPVDDVEMYLSRALAAARALNPSLRRMVVTVSPVRHWREGAVASSRSKAHLLAAAHAACEAHDARVAHYFPSYEILLDELRDYRWYADDMLHPSDAAVSYITERLVEEHFDRADDELRAEVGSVRVAARHRHARPASKAARAFASAQLERCRTVHKAHPHLAASGALCDELAMFERILQNP